MGSTLVFMVAGSWCIVFSQIFLKTFPLGTHQDTRTRLNIFAYVFYLEMLVLIKITVESDNVIMYYKL